MQLLGVLNAALLILSLLHQYYQFGVVLKMVK